MTSSPVGVSWQPDADILARSTAEQLIRRLAEAQQVRPTASLVLTGGGIGIAVLSAVRDHPDRDAVQWGAVDVWWGDERFVPAADPERNEGQARAALLDHVPLDPARVHPMAPSDGPSGTDVDAAAAAYADELRTEAGGLAVPAFDVLLLGVGPEGHTASIFPDSPAATDGRPVFAVRDCPKPPPTRISLGFSAINRARAVWVVVSGQGKAEAVRSALAGAEQTALPAAGVHGQEQTLWLLDEPAAEGWLADRRA